MCVSAIERAVTAAIRPTTRMAASDRWQPSRSSSASCGRSCSAFSPVSRSCVSRRQEHEPTSSNHIHGVDACTEAFQSAGASQLLLRKSDVCSTVATGCRYANITLTSLHISDSANDSRVSAVAICSGRSSTRAELARIRCSSAVNCDSTSSWYP